MADAQEAERYLLQAGALVDELTAAAADVLYERKLFGAAVVLRGTPSLIDDFDDWGSKISLSQWRAQEATYWRSRSQAVGTAVRKARSSERWKESGIDETFFSMLRYLSWDVFTFEAALIEGDFSNLASSADLVHLQVTKVSQRLLELGSTNRAARLVVAGVPWESVLEVEDIVFNDN